MSEINKARQTAEKETAQTAKIIDAGKEFYNDARSRLDDSIDDAQTYGKGALKDARSWIKKNPGLAIGGAIVFGMLLSTLLSNRDND